MMYYDILMYYHVLLSNKKLVPIIRKDFYFKDLCSIQ